MTEQAPEPTREDVERLVRNALWQGRTITWQGRTTITPRDLWRDDAEPVSA